MLRAVLIGADAILLAKNVDGVYSADPKLDPSAVRYEKLSYDQVLEQHLAVMDSDDPYFQEQCLLAAMWTKDSKLFWARFSKYLSQHPGQPVPRYYKEAAYLFSYLEENSPFQVQVDEGMKRTFDAFAKTLEQHDGSDIEDARKALYPLYGDTYYYEFFLMEDTKYL